MRCSTVVVFILTAFDPIFALKCFSFARHELKLDDIFDYGLVQCPETSTGCFYYPHWQCFGKNYGIAYSITGCLNNPNLCKTTKTATKLNDVARCCYYTDCNYAIYKYLTSLNSTIPVHDFKDCDPRGCKECVEILPDTSTTTSDQSVTAPIVKYSSQKKSTVEKPSTGKSETTYRVTSTTPSSTKSLSTTTASTITSSSKADTTVPTPPGSPRKGNEEIEI